MDERDTTGLEKLYETGPLMWSNGEQFDYRGWILEKVECPHSEHTEFQVLNPAGTKIESLMLKSDGSQIGLSLDQIISMMDKMVAVDPESMEEWLSWTRSEPNTQYRMGN